MRLHSRRATGANARGVARLVSCGVPCLACGLRAWGCVVSVPGALCMYLEDVST